MRLCEYKSGETACKNWIVDKDDDVTMCPIHLGNVMMRTERETAPKTATESRFEYHMSLCESMSDEELKNHILQLESLLEDVKLRQQAAQHTRTKRIKAALASGTLTQEQLAEIRDARSRNLMTGKQGYNKPDRVPILSKEEKEIQKLMKSSGLPRDKVKKLLDMD